MNIEGPNLARVPGFRIFATLAYFLKILGRNDASPERVTEGYFLAPGAPGAGLGAFFPYFSFNLGIFFQIKNKKGSREGLFSLFLKFLGRSVG